ncbi:MAG TPA: helix-turn-helix domain-containing protein [Candidatus Limnocylindrales bacterium]|jgi:hypothetical protein|nr:helix-turn-helix domain-containing protein [Candidatus Limnocylindrales bacterium]
MNKKEWDHARFNFLDRLRRDVRLSPATRLVGLEIGSYLNSVSGEAFPSNDTLAAVLNLNPDTISVAIKELQKDWYTVERRPCPEGRKNYFRPRFSSRLEQEEDRNFRSTNREEDRKKPSGRSEFSLKEDRKNHPITPSSNSFRTLSRVHSGSPGPGPSPPPTEKAQGLLEHVAQLAGLPSVDTFRWPEAWRVHGGKIVQRWLDEGWPDFVIVEAVRATMAIKRDGPPNSPRYFDPPIRRMLAALDRPLPVAREAGG